MKKIILIALIGLISTSCQKSEEAKKVYLIAYNVFAPDSINPNNYEVMIMKIDGSDKKNLTSHKDVAWTYYAYKDRLFFISDRDTAYRNYFLYEMNFV